MLIARLPNFGRHRGYRIASQILPFGHSGSHAGMEPTLIGRQLIPESGGGETKMRNGERGRREKEEKKCFQDSKMRFCTAAFKDFTLL